MPQRLELIVAVSIVVLFGGFIVSIIYIAFLAISFTTFQKIAAILVIIPAMMAILVLDVDILRHEAGYDWEQAY